MTARRQFFVSALVFFPLLPLVSPAATFSAPTFPTAEVTHSPPSSRSQDPRQPVIEAVGRAERALALGEPEIAESALRDAIREGWLLLGQLDLADGDATSLAAAEAAFRQALAASSSLRGPLMSLALLQVRLGDSEAARDTLRQLLIHDPADGPARRLLAQVLVSDGETARAVQELEEGWAAAPGDLETAFALATGYLRMENLERAAELYQLISKERPIAETRVLIGRTYRDFSHFDLATSWLEDALELDIDVRRARYYLGTVILLRIGMEGLRPAIELFEQELERSPEDPMTYLYLGSALVEERQLERALPLLDRAAQWPPVHFDALRYKGRALLSLGRAPEAAEILGRALELSQSGSSRDLAELHYQLGTAKRSIGEMDEAKGHFKLAKELGRELAAQHREKFASFVRDEAGRPSSAEASAVDPFDLDDGEMAALDEAQRAQLEASVRLTVARASMNLGVLDARAGRFLPAAGHFQRARDAFPVLTDLDRSLGMAFFRAERFERAIPPLERALEQAENAADPASGLAIRRALAASHLSAENYQATISLLDADPGLPTTPALQMTYAVALARAGRGSEAAPIFEKLTASGAEWPGLHVVLGQAKAQEGDYAAAENSLKRALELDPKAADARLSLGEIMMRQGRLEEAASTLQAEIKQRPRNIKARYLLATVLDLDRRSEEAEGQIRALLRLAPGHINARYLLGKILLASGDAASAIEQLEAALEGAPEDANIHYQLGQAYQRSGRREDAKRHFDIFQSLKAEQRGS